ncbi:MAG: hypothetical protein H7Z41_06720 [Cytophagales bacterium]|nr:hypothetical protein [Armatimonadota bacterium]
MNIRVFAWIVGALVVTMLGFGIWKLANQWDYERIGQFDTRRNNITGMVEIKDDAGRWTPSFKNDRYAPGIPETDLKGIRLTDGAWGADGILTGRARNPSPNKAVVGRVGFLVRIYYPDGRRLKDRTLRATVNWPAQSSTVFIMDTNLPTPASNQKWTLDMVTAYDADGGSS